MSDFSHVIDKFDQLCEASNLTPEQKVDAWANGTRRENIKACGDDKLKLYRAIAVRKNYRQIILQIDGELARRGVKISQVQPSVATQQTNIINSNNLLKLTDSIKQALDAEDAVRVISSYDDSSVIGTVGQNQKIEFAHIYEIYTYWLDQAIEEEDVATGKELNLGDLQKTLEDELLPIVQPLVSAFNKANNTNLEAKIGLDSLFDEEVTIDVSSKAPLIIE